MAAGIGRKIASWSKNAHAAAFIFMTFAAGLFVPVIATAQHSTIVQAPVTATASPLDDDATLRDVTFCGDRLGIAVGDRGVIWRTSDGGRTWQFVSSGVKASLRCVQMLTDRLGWIAGLQVDPEPARVTGIVLATRDGGLTWTRLDNGLLPGLRTVQFFDDQTGVVAGETTADGSTGIFTTNDGGRTWQSVAGSSAGGWQAAAFTGETHGVLVGDRGSQGLFGNGRLLPMRPTSVMRGLRDVVMSHDHRGWLVGDGGLVRRTDNNGASWPEPRTPLPQELRDSQDLRAVAMQNDHVWVAGSPGSVVWHSHDDGHHWEPQFTGETIPIEALHFVNEQFGCAVGAFGRISLTTDGGQTWQTVRGGQRRSAVLSLLGDKTQLPSSLLMRESGEQGYRSVAWLLARRDVGTQGDAHRHEAERLRAGLLAVGGNEADVNWRLPITLPDVDRDEQQLVAEWSRLTDQRLPDVVLGNLVAGLRTWRPEILVLNEITPSDAVTKLIHQAALMAVEQAADPTRYPEHRALLGLAPWRVQKVFVRSSTHQPGTVTVDPQQLLLRQKGTIEEASAASLQLIGRNRRPGELESFRLIAVAPALQSPDSTQRDVTLGRGLWNGLTSPNSREIRRELLPLSDINEEQLLQLARHRRNFLNYASRLLDDPTRGSELLAQLESTTRPMPPDQAARLLSDLAEEYRRRSQWESVEDTLIQLVERYPEQPQARPAMQWLLANWTSQEMIWQRLRVSADNQRRTINRDEVVRSGAGALLQANVANAIEIARNADNALQANIQVADLPEVQPVTERTGTGSIRQGTTSNILQVGAQNPGGAPGSVGVNQRDSEVVRRRQQANRVAALLQRIDPALFQQPQVQFSIAALLRQQQQAAAAAEIYRQFFGLDDAVSPWNLAARGELWLQSRGPLSPKPVLRCVRTPQPPVLDGVLSDACWKNASPVTLTAKPDRSLNGNEPTFVGANRLDARRSPEAIVPYEGTSATVMVSYDDRFLYLAASVPRADGVKPDPVQLPGRTHDADLTSFDRIIFSFDIDRDYTTFYRFDIDQRGWTHEALWEDVHWNPQWYVAADSDEQTWRVEAAIPLEALCPMPPTRGTVWAAGFQRIIPAQGVQGWTYPVSETPRGETFGLIQFE